MTTEPPRLSVTREPCADCPFAGRFVGLRSGRLRDIVEETRRSDSYFVCHRTVDYGDEERGTDAVFGPAAICSGWRSVGFAPTVLQVSERMGWIEEVDPL